MITFRKLENRITGQFNGKPFNCPRTDEAEQFFASIRDNEDADVEFKDIEEFIFNLNSVEVASKSRLIYFLPSTGRYYLEHNGVRSKKPIPKFLADFIEDSAAKDIDFTPVVLAWLRLLANPRVDDSMIIYFMKYIQKEYTDMDQVEELVEAEKFERDEAIHMCTYPDLAITQEGLLATYKVADQVTHKYEMIFNEETEEFEKVKKERYKKTEPVIDDVTGEVLKEAEIIQPDFKEDMIFTPAIYKSGHKFYSNDKLGYVYKVGEMQSLPSEAPRNLTHTFGGGGLYIGGLSYIENYRNHATHVLTCFVNPSDILSFQDNGSAIRVDALFPNNVWESDIPLKNKYHSSTYGKLSEERLEELLRNATKDGICIKEYQENLPNE